MTCELCGSEPCHCDRNDTHPVDADADTWADIYGNMDDFEDYLDHDHSMDY